MVEKIWNEDEVRFLEENYSNKGLEFCKYNLNKTKRQIRAKLQRLGLKLNQIEKYKYDNFKKIIDSSINLIDVCKNLGISKNYGNRQTIKKYIEIYNLDISHFYIPTSYINKRLKLNEILVSNSAYRDTTSLKNKLYKEGLKFRKCELCGQDENWNDNHMSLILDHINGVNNDNRIENLRIVCPNCNATLDTHCKGNNKLSDKYIKKNKEKYKFCECGKKILITSNACEKCAQINQRKVERPSYETLLKELEESNYSAVGRKYGVSDNSIRKWLKSYKKQLSQYENI